MRARNFSYIAGKKYDGMMGRCYRKADKSYPRYGGRGIAVAGAWIKDINQFRTWLLNELEKNNISIEQFVNSPYRYQLDRINIDGHYAPDNCRIASPQQNMRNKSGNLTTVRSAEGEIIELRKDPL